MRPLSHSPGTGGGIKTVATDFVVKEITANGTTLEPDRKYTGAELGDSPNPEGKFTTFVLQKRDWNTIQALATISKKVGHGRKSIGYAGTKDRISVSVQLASVYGTTPEKLESVKVKDISINGAWLSNGVEMGSNIGNAFEVIVSDLRKPQNADRVISELGGRIANYFDKQRFGSRLGNAKTGLAIMRGDFESAAMLVLTDSTGELNEKAVAARKQLKDEQDFKAALSYFPGYLKNERYVMDYLATHDGDYAGALRRLPRGISLMFIHAVQSLIFNLEVEQRIKEEDFNSKAYCKSNAYGFPDSDSVIDEKSDFALAPLIGYETRDDHITEQEKEILENLEITKESFKIKSMPELSMRGSFRSLLAPVKNLSASAQSETLRLSFAIPSGSYATVLINEITKSEDLDLKKLS